MTDCGLSVLSSCMCPHVLFLHAAFLWKIVVVSGAKCLSCVALGSLSMSEAVAEQVPVDRRSGPFAAAVWL